MVQNQLPFASPLVSDARRLRACRRGCYALSALLGQTIDGKYRLVSELGAGGMGSVYEAEHMGTGRRVAVKVVNMTDTAKDETLIRRFQREARAAGAIDSRHIGQVLDTGLCKTSGVPFMVMEFLSGEDMSQMFRRVGPIDPQLVLRIGAQVCQGLMRAHAAGIVHRDIKPANIYLARQEDGTVVCKLLDFGVAKMWADQALTAEDGSLTRTGSMIGSPLYMSPEQARGAKDIDGRADIWSLGIVLFEALTGRTPYHHIDALGELILAICSSLPPIVQDDAPWVSKEVAAVVHRALSLPPEQRYQSAEEFFAAIRPLISETEIRPELLQPLEDQVRSQVAPRLSPTPGAEIMTPLPRAPMGSQPWGGAISESSPGAQQAVAGTSNPAFVDSSSRPGAGSASSLGSQDTHLSNPGLDGASREGTHRGVAHSPIPETAKSRRPLILLAVGALIAGGITSVLVLGGSSEPAATSAGEAVDAPEDGTGSPIQGTGADPDPKVNPGGSPDASASTDPVAAGGSKPTDESPPADDTSKTAPSAAPETVPPPPPKLGGPLPTQSHAPVAPPPPTGLDTEGFGDRK